VLRKPSCAVAGVALVATLTAAAFAGVLLTKTRARAVALAVTSETCRSFSWCLDYEVVPAQNCRRADSRLVYCRIAFVTADSRRCGGVVMVRRARGGRIDRGMAVPQNCSAPATVSDPGVPV
jgi:hypothetical protein